MVSYVTAVFCSILIGVLLNTQKCTAGLVDSNRAEFNQEGTYDDSDTEQKRGGARAWQGGLKRGGGRAFAQMAEKRGGGRGFNFYDSGFVPLDKRAGGRAFYGYGDYVLPYYFQQQYKRGGGRAFVPDRSF